MTDLLLGIDGGGTSTVAWLSDVEGNLLGRGRSGASNLKVVGPQAACGALRSAIAAAFADASRPIATAAVACLGLAGFDRPEGRELLHRWSAEFRWALRLVLVNDGDLIIAAGTPEGWGVGVIAGTGSIAVGRAPDGRKARAGGWGPLMGDEGSAYAVVLSALRLVLRRVDGRSRRPAGDDRLTSELCRALAISGPSELVNAIYSPSCDRTTIAGLAPAVTAAAAVDPEIEATILNPAGEELAEAVLAVAGALSFPEGCELPLAMAGGFLLATPPVSRALVASLARSHYRFTAAAVAEPVRGATLLARRAFGEG